ncbi:cobalamin-dependent protein, partial [Candidatus Bathyarchaeota archaeon]|nr:cobalamin-dependent protein [Candidatus Bathyarchaeota archaeon]
MNVTLINPPVPFLANDASYPPMGLLYLASRLQQLGHHVKVEDLTGGVDWRKEVEGLEADVFGLPCVTPNFNIVREISYLLPADKPIIVGNVHATFLPEDTLKNIRCNAVVKGESEVVIETVMNDIENGKLQRIYDGGIVSVDAIP